MTTETLDRLRKKAESMTGDKLSEFFEECQAAADYLDDQTEVNKLIMLATFKAIKKTDGVEYCTLGAIAYAPVLTLFDEESILYMQDFSGMIKLPERTNKFATIEEDQFKQVQSLAKKRLDEIYEHINKEYAKDNLFDDSYADEEIEYLEGIMNGKPPHGYTVVPYKY